MSSDPQRRTFARLAVLGLPGTVGLFWLLFWAISRHPAFALLAAGLVAGTALACFLAVARTASGPRPPTAFRLGLVVALFAVQSGLMVALLLIAFGVPLLWALGAGAGVGGVMTAYCIRSKIPQQLRGLANQRPVSFDTRDDASRQIAGAAQYVVPAGFPTRPTSAQLTMHRETYEANERLNKARAQMRLAADEADHDLLLTALDGVRDTLREAGLDPALALLAARDLVNAESTLAQRSHDGTRYVAAVNLYGRLAGENPAFDWARATAHAQRADYQAFETMLASGDLNAAAAAGDVDAASRACSRLLDAYHAVETELTAAIDLTDEDAGILPQYMSELGLHLCLSLPLLGQDRSSEGISVIRSALALITARKGELRRSVELALAVSLIERYQFRADHPDVAGDPDEHDLDEAFPLLLRLVREPNPVKARAWQLMLTLVTMSQRQRAVTVPQAAREAFAAARSDAIIDLVPITGSFVAWTESNDVPAGTRAEAHSMSLVAMERDAMRRELPADRLRLLGDSQHVGAEAGFWLAKAGQPGQAVLAAEQSRGILLSRLIGGLAPAVSIKLTAAGRADLVAGYLDALRARAEAYRGQFGAAAGEEDSGAAPARGILRGETFYPAGVMSPLEAAHSELTRLNREITAITGIEMQAGQPDYADIERAAGAAPVVYLGGASSGGFALLVRRHGKPTFVELPAMTRDALARHAEAFRQGPSARAVRDCTGWLADTALAGLLPRIADDHEIALVPLGALNALPVNGALLQATRGRPAGPVAVRHLPNARAAAQPDSPWPGIRAGTTAMLVVDAAAPRDERRLRLARSEAAALAHQYGASRLEDATVAAVLAALPRAEVVQFLCHGQADLENPLAGGLILTDGRLTVQQLFARPPTGRPLVIVAACESHVAGTAAPDEIVGLPAALYQAGASGIIAAQWQVDERAAALLLRHFHRRLRDGDSPVRALTAAQSWLSTVTRPELLSQHPDLFRHYRPASRAVPDPDGEEEPPYGEPAYWSAFSYTGT